MILSHKWGYNDIDYCNIILIILYAQKGADINAQNAQGETPLHGAALKGYEQVTTSLIELGADVRD